MKNFLNNVFVPLKEQNKFCLESHPIFAGHIRVEIGFDEPVEKDHILYNHFSK